MNIEGKLIARLVIGMSVPYELIDNEKIERFGRYYGGFSDEWGWNKSKLLNASENELIELIEILKTYNE